jgi:hypothetical protein
MKYSKGELGEEEPALTVGPHLVGTSVDPHQHREGRLRVRGGRPAARGSGWYEREPRGGYIEVEAIVAERTVVIPQVAVCATEDL